MKINNQTKMNTLKETMNQLSTLPTPSQESKLEKDKLKYDILKHWYDTSPESFKYKPTQTFQEIQERIQFIWSIKGTTNFEEEVFRNELNKWRLQSDDSPWKDKQMLSAAETLLKLSPEETPVKSKEKIHHTYNLRARHP